MNTTTDNAPKQTASMVATNEQTALSSATQGLREALIALRDDMRTGGWERNLEADEIDTILATHPPQQERALPPGRAYTIARAVLDKLYDYNGFGGWFNGFDKSQIESICNSLAAVIRERIAAAPAAPATPDIPSAQHSRRPVGND